MLSAFSAKASCLLKQKRDLSFGERKMLDTAKNLLMKEIALANKVKEDQVAKDIERIFEN